MTEKKKLRMGSLFVLAAVFAVLTTVVNAEKGDLTYVSGYYNQSNLENPGHMIISPDGKNAYVSSTTKGIAWFTRNTSTGELTYVGKYKPTGSSNAYKVCISPDGKHVYLGDASSSSIYWFTRNLTTGVLTYVNKYTSAANIPSSSGSTVSPDGKHVYVTSTTLHNVCWFNRNSTTGALTYVGKYTSSTNIGSARDVRVSPDGLHVYVAASNNDGVARFTRNSTTGALTYVGKYTSSTYMDGANGLAISADGLVIYVTGANSHSIAWFSRTVSTGALTYVNNYTSNVNIYAPASVEVSRDGYNVYAAGTYTDATNTGSITWFKRDIAGGALTYVGKYKSSSIYGTRAAVTLSPNGCNVYAIGRTAHGVSCFSKETINGTIVAWGWNPFGQCDAPAGDNFVTIAGGWMHNVAVKKDGSLVAWGSNASGGCDVPSGNDYVAVAAGMWSGLALKKDGSLAAWGDNSHGQRTVPSGNNFVAIGSGYEFNIALKSDGSLTAWGDNTYGQCTVPAGTNYIAIAASAFHSIALKNDGSLVFWGKNDYGMGTVPSGNDYVAIKAGNYHNIAIKRDGSTVAWGSNVCGESNVPVGNDFDAVAGGIFTSYALNHDGTLNAWGDDANDQCDVPDGNDFLAVSAGGYHGLAIKKSQPYIDDLLVSYEPNETNLIVTPAPWDTGLTTTWPLLGGSGGVPQATEGAYVLKMNWPSQADGKVQIKHDGLDFDLVNYDSLFIDVYMTSQLSPTVIGISDDVIIPSWQAVESLPAEVGQWCTLEVDVSDCNQTNLEKIDALVFEGMVTTAGTIYVDNIRLRGVNPYYIPPVPKGLTASGADKRIDLVWEPVLPEDGLAGYNIYRSTSAAGTYTKINSSPHTMNVYSDFFGTNGQTYYYRITAVGGQESGTSDVVSAGSAAMTDDQLLTSVQKATFRYFWDFAHPDCGMARERDASWDRDNVTTGGSGMGLMAICVGVERGFVTRAEAAQRVLKILNFLDGVERFHGAWSHWMNGKTGEPIPFDYDANNMPIIHGDIIETSYMAAGLLTVRKYFNSGDATETAVRNLATELWEGIEWDWFSRPSDTDGTHLWWYWSSTHGWGGSFPFSGYTESTIAYILGIASPTHPIPASCYYYGWAGLTDYANGKTFYGCLQLVGPDKGGPLFFTHYSYLGFDPNWSDAYCNYFQNSRNISLINRAWCNANPGGFAGYSNLVWGLTSGQDPYVGYKEHAPDSRDNGTINPTAALSAMPYTPTESIATLKHFYNTYGAAGLWGPFGFVDGFNLQADPDWYSTNGYLAIDQGPIVVMMENYRTGLVWDLFMSNSEITSALNAIAASLPTPDTFDNFDGDNINGGWLGSGGSWTITSADTAHVHGGTYALKAIYNKGTETWSHLYAVPDTGYKDFSDYSMVRFWIYPDKSVNYTFKCEYTGGAVERTINLTANVWQQVILGIGNVSSTMATVNNVLIFPEGGTSGVSGTFWIDDITLQ